MAAALTGKLTIGQCNVTTVCNINDLCLRPDTTSLPAVYVAITMMILILGAATAVTITAVLFFLRSERNKR